MAKVHRFLAIVEILRTDMVDADPDVAFDFACDAACAAAANIYDITRATRFDLEGFVADAPVKAGAIDYEIPPVADDADDEDDEFE